MDKDTVVTLLKYKRWIDLATLQAIRAIDGTVDGGKRHLTIRLMNHIHVVDMISGRICAAGRTATPR
ncbi:DinB family protein [Klebsiella pneumoniae]|nr:DinB family protein [Klebsiella pneumoniae]